MLSLALSFFAIALAYATVGFGGGSSYIAVLAVANIPYATIPRISLICNILVVTGGCYQYLKKGHFRKRLALPLVCSSVPMAFIGGLYPIKEEHFYFLLALTLFLGGIRVLFIKDRNVTSVQAPSFYMSVLVGGFLGLLSGLVGIGGGIFLSPLMLNLRWARPKEVAAIASAFIWLNSIAGLTGQLLKGHFNLSELNEYWILLAAVIVGGQVGSRLGTHAKVPQLWIQRGTGVLIILVSGRIILKIVST